MVVVEEEEAEGRGMVAARCKGMVEVVVDLEVVEGIGGRGRGRGKVLPPPPPAPPAAATSEARGPPSTGALVLTDQVTSERGPVDGAPEVEAAAAAGGGAGRGAGRGASSRKVSLSRASAMTLRIACREPLSLDTKFIKADSREVRDSAGHVDFRIFKYFESIEV